MLVKDEDFTAAIINRYEQLRKTYFSEEYLDDFGNGYTSLDDLCDYPVDIIKIDRHFVLKTLSGRGHSLLQGIVNTAHELGTRVLCEGIETDTQDENVKKANCDYIQGFYYSRVLPIEEADNYYKKYNSKSKK